MKRYVTLASALLMGTVIGNKTPRVTATMAEASTKKMSNNKAQVSANTNNAVLRTNFKKKITKIRKSSESVKKECRECSLSDNLRMRNGHLQGRSGHLRISGSPKNHHFKRRPKKCGKSKKSESSGKVGTNPSCSKHSKRRSITPGTSPSPNLRRPNRSRSHNLRR